MTSTLAQRVRVLVGSTALLALPLPGGAEAAVGQAEEERRQKVAQRAAQPPIEGKSVIFGEEFDAPIQWGTKWNGHHTDAFEFGDHNPHFYNLDWISEDQVTVTPDGLGKFSAKPSAHTLETGLQAWDTGLMTTEYTTKGFQVRTGDYVETRFELPDEMGAWPALWTWSVDHPDDLGNDEVDSFEYHPDSVTDLELTNHLKLGDVDIHKDENAIGPCKWITVGTYYGLDSVDWYVNGEKVFSDGVGVAHADWQSHLIMNLGISDGKYHPAPTGPIDFYTDYIRVYR